MLQTPSTDFSDFGQFSPDGIIARLVNLTEQCPPHWAGKRRAFFLRSVAVKLLRGRPLDVCRYGARMRLYPYNNVCEKRILFTPQYFDPAELALLQSRVSGDYVFLDIGANIGAYALFVAARAGPRARILAIEPQPDIFEQLVYNIRQNPFATVKAINCALADIEGEITLFVHPRNRGQTSMRMVTAEAGSSRLKVAAKALTSVVRDEGFERIDAAKIDVQGAEDLVLEAYLRDAPAALWPRLILLENASKRWDVDLCAELAARGYREILRTRNNLAFEMGSSRE